MSSSDNIEPGSCAVMLREVLREDEQTPGAPPPTPVLTLATPVPAAIPVENQNEVIPSGSRVQDADGQPTALDNEKGKALDKGKGKALFQRNDYLDNGLTDRIWGHPSHGVPGMRRPPPTSPEESRLVERLPSTWQPLPSDLSLREPRRGSLPEQTSADNYPVVNVSVTEIDLTRDTSPLPFDAGRSGGYRDSASSPYAGLWAGWGATLANQQELAVPAPPSPPVLPGHQTADVSAAALSSATRTHARFYCTDYPPCTLSFTRREHLERHISKHIGKSPFTYCGRRFDRLDDLGLHTGTYLAHLYQDVTAAAAMVPAAVMVPIEGGNSMNDNDVAMSGTEGASANGTITTTTPGGARRARRQQRFPCTDFPPCDLIFDRSEHLRRHVSKHIGKRPFMCHHCDLRFSRLQNLRRHEANGHPHEDRNGPAAAAVPAELANSTTDNASRGPQESSASGTTTTPTGNEKKPRKQPQSFPCTDFPPCNLIFTRSEHLRRHVSKHTGNRPFMCHHCTQRFYRPENLRLHAQHEHPQEVLEEQNRQREQNSVAHEVQDEPKTTVAEVTADDSSSEGWKTPKPAVASRIISVIGLLVCLGLVGLVIAMTGKGRLNITAGVFILVFLGCITVMIFMYMRTVFRSTDSGVVKKRAGDAGNANPSVSNRTDSPMYLLYRSARTARRN